ncbi:hypothetical protein D3C81_1764420 [compost metagenome]
MRRASTPASVSCLSRSLPRLAPVIRLMRSGCWRARSASALGTALASPARVKPLMPTVMPSSIKAAASAALITLSSREGIRTRSRNMGETSGSRKYEAASLGTGGFFALRPRSKNRRYSYLLTTKDVGLFRCQKARHRHEAGVLWSAVELSRLP